MAGVNKVILLGRVGQEPEMKTLESGATVTKLSLATTESYKDKQGQRVDNTEWHDLEAWEGIAKAINSFVKKGDLIYIEGKIKSDVWQDEQGNNRKRTKIRVTTMTMMPKGTGQESKPQNPSPIDVSTGGANSGFDPDKNGAGENGFLDGDLPF
jgi:single-strand DNA-binding protein